MHSLQESFERCGSERTSMSLQKLSMQEVFKSQNYQKQEEKSYIEYEKEAGKK